MAAQHSVAIYTTPTCTFCVAAKKFLSENKVKYAEYKVAEDEGRALEMFKKTGQTGVPVIDIDGNIIVGYDRRAIKEALGLK